MTQQEANNLVQGIYDGIFNSVTKGEAGGKPLMNASSTVLTLMKPGLAIRGKDFANPYTPGNLTGSKDAALNTAQLVDAAPKMSSLYNESGNQISVIYKQMLDAVSIPAQPANPALDKQIADATAVLYRTVVVTDPDTGQQSNKTMESQLYRDYLDNQAAYTNARQAYIAAYLAAMASTTTANTWPLLAPTFQIPVKAAYDRWRSAGADQVEQNLAILNTSSQNGLQKAFDNAKKLYEGYGIVLDETSSGMAPVTQRVSLLPSDWYSSSSTATKWTKVDISSGNNVGSNTSDFTSYGGSAGFSMGIFSIGGSAGHSSSNQHMSNETKNLRVSFEYSLVLVRRPWLTFNLFGLKGWNVGNLMKKSTISNGAKTGQDKSLMPLLPTAFVAARNIKISANWSKSDWDLAKSATTGGGSFGIGPFSIGGSYSHSSSKETWSSAFANGIITVPGVQIIGVINQIVPFCPPS